MSKLGRNVLSTVSKRSLSRTQEALQHLNQNFYALKNEQNDTFLLKGKINFNVIDEKCKTIEKSQWNLDHGALRETRSHFSKKTDGLQCPTLTITAPEEDMLKILASKVDLNVAEFYGMCQLKWGDFEVKQSFGQILNALNNSPREFKQ